MQAESFAGSPSIFINDLSLFFLFRVISLPCFRADQAITAPLSKVPSAPDQPPPLRRLAPQRPDIQAADRATQPRRQSGKMRAPICPLPAPTSGMTAAAKNCMATGATASWAPSSSQDRGRRGQPPVPSPIRSIERVERAFRPLTEMPSVLTTIILSNFTACCRT